jgi:hypothetical protein
LALIEQESVMRPVLAGIAAVLALTGCAAQHQYAAVTGRIGAAAPLDIAGVAITGIDGQIHFDGREEREIKPGFHTLMVITTREKRSLGRASGMKEREPAYIDLNAKPCMRYFVIARHESGDPDSPWKPEIARAEPIDGCTAEEKPTNEGQQGIGPYWSE